MDLISVSDWLCENLKKLCFNEPVSYVYDPTDYARAPLSDYYEKYGKAPKKVVFVGMNPGPWGMLQTGIPFGEISYVRDWMGIEAPVGRPDTLHPKRPVEGFSCQRSEVSGSRLWGWARQRFKSPDLFFRDFLVINYCPLAFFDREGRNITPDKLKAEDKARLFGLCDGATMRTVRLLEPEWVIGIGRFAYERCVAALEALDLKVGKVTHPSPANPAANRGWEGIVEQELKDLGIELPKLKEE